MEVIGSSSMDKASLLWELPHLDLEFGVWTGKDPPAIPAAQMLGALVRGICFPLILGLVGAVKTHTTDEHRLIFT